MSSFRAEPHLARLKQFQRATVDHVVKRLYLDDRPGRRFLVADETGLGKSLVARGVIARAIEILSQTSAAPRIDIVYVCSNAEIAEQNLRRLDVLGVSTSQHATRLTRLAEVNHQLDGEPHPEVGKRVNLVSFTPGTSFELGRRTGQAPERALLHRILCDAAGFSSKWDKRAAAVVLQGRAKFETMQRLTGRVDASLDATIIRAFLKIIRPNGVLRRFKAAVNSLGRRINITEEERAQHHELIADLRTALAAAGIESLEPDLVILDEFQRFRHLLANDDPRYEEAAELANALFSYRDARVLLLSATPYKPFTYAEEASSGDDHYADLARTIRFLCEGNESGLTDGQILGDLQAYRGAAISGQDVEKVRQRLEQSLLSIMCRTERPQLGDDGMLVVRAEPATPVEADDLLAFAGLRKIARHLDTPLTHDYWKSTPYFVNFSDGYLFGDRLRKALGDSDGRAALRSMLDRTQLLDAKAVTHLRPIEPGNARMRQLTEQTVGAGWWRLLWVPPSVPYDDPQGPYAEVEPMTKRLIFSSWSATPTAIASLISHAARVEMSGGLGPPSENLRRLSWRDTAGRPGSMTTLALIWPSPVLARSVAPGGERVRFPRLGARAGAEPWYWTSLFAEPGAVPEGVDDLAELGALLSGELEVGTTEHGLLENHIDLALAINRGRREAGAERRTDPPADLAQVLTMLARFGPGNVAFRSLERLVRPHDSVTEFGLWRAAAVISGALHSLFNRAETIALLDRVMDSDVVYWRRVLMYCRWGNLEAVLDEYLHHLAADHRAVGLDDDSLGTIAQRVARSIMLVPAQYGAFDPLQPERGLTFSSRFALRYGNKRGGEQESARLPDIRDAFNSPFRPFVLATTSVGQEGLDFHWWCHAVVHWNTPANPVDFEQREGRVHRFGGHAIRRNLAARNGGEILAAAQRGASPWDRAYELGVERNGAVEYGELSPYWILPGKARIERHVLPYPLSQDLDRYRRLREDLTLYRLTFGQPRQEDLLELLRSRSVHLDPKEMSQLRLNLSPVGRVAPHASDGRGG